MDLTGLKAFLGKLVENTPEHQDLTPRERVSVMEACITHAWINQLLGFMVPGPEGFKVSRDQILNFKATYAAEADKVRANRA
jgi:hypothetical protein